jgi:hypothetical protein
LIETKKRGMDHCTFLEFEILHRSDYFYSKPKCERASKV